MAARENAVSRILEAGPALLPLLTQLEQRPGELAEPGTQDFLRRLLVAAREQWPGAVPAAQAPRDATLPLNEPLSSRELQIIEWMARGDSNADIGQHLKISENTVKWHLKNVFAKLCVTNRTAAVIAAQQRHLLG